PVRKPDAGDPHVRFDERDVETELWSGYLGTARRKGRQQITRAYRHRATSRLYKVIVPTQLAALLLLGLYWRARYTFICAALSSPASPVMSTSTFFTVPVNANGDL